VTESTNFKWYVLRAISGKETKVKEYIEAEMRISSLSDFVKQVLIPEEKTFTIRNGKKVEKMRNAMPGYVLVEANLVGETFHRLRNTPNVLGFLEENGHQPTPARIEEVNRFLGRMDDIQDAEQDIMLFFNVGDNVKVTSGPFQNFSGVIEEVNIDKKKLKVMVMIFGRKNLLELSFTQVEKE
jgi:transcriptional antiterminator NusG